MQLMVVGMHRSGTSMLARLLNLMGVYFAPEGTGTGANQENPKGFWERRDVRALNDFVLHSVGCDWNRVSTFDVSRLPEAVVDEFLVRASRIVLDMDANRPWFLKEPRLCLLMPLWRRVLEAPVCVHILRHPVEVAASLRARNQMPMEVGLALWEAYNRSARVAMEGIPLVQVVHRDLVRDPVGAVAGLHHRLELLGVRRLSAPADVEVGNFVSRDLYREREDAAGLSEFSQASQVSLFKQWSGQPQGAQTGELSAKERGTLAAYEASLPPMAAPAKAVDKTAVEAELRSKAAAAERQVQALKAQEQHAQALLKLRDQHLGFLEREFSSLREVYAGRESAASELLTAVNKLLIAQDDRARLEEQLERQASELAHWREEVARLQREIDEAQESAIRKHEACVSIESELEAAKRSGIDARKALEASEARAAAQAKELITLTRLLLDTNAMLGSVSTQLDALRDEHASCLSQHAEAAAGASALREELDRRLDACRSQHVRELAAASSRNSHLERELAERDDRLSTLHEAAAVCGAELDRLDRQLNDLRRSTSWRLTAPMRHARRMLQGGRAPSNPPAAVEILRQSPWFDAAWYTARYPDVVASGLSPEVHFLVIGAANAMDPSPMFDTGYYLERNPDVAKSGQNPLLHFIQFGEAEGRLPAPGESKR